MPLSLFLLLWGLMVEIEADCYSRDGIAALHSGFYGGPELISCGNGTTNCCLADQRCGTNLLCTDLNGGISRQYCDNPNWHGCSNMCPGNDGAGLYLLDCGNNIFCCTVKEVACCKDERAFYVDPENGAVVQTTVPAKTKQPRYFEADAPSEISAFFSSFFGTAYVTLSTGSASVSSGSLQTAVTSNFTSTSLSPASTLSSAILSTIATSTSSNLASTAPSSPSSPGLSAGAGAGIGIGAIAGVALLGGAVWLLLRRRKQKTSPSCAAVHEIYDNCFVSELATQPHSSYARLYELNSSQDVAQELEGSPRQDRIRHELDVSTA